MVTPSSDKKNKKSKTVEVIEPETSQNFQLLPIEEEELEFEENELEALERQRKQKINFYPDIGELYQNKKDNKELYQEWEEKVKTGREEVEKIANDRQLEIGLGIEPEKKWYEIESVESIKEDNSDSSDEERKSAVDSSNNEKSALALFRESRMGFGKQKAIKGYFASGVGRATALDRAKTGMQMQSIMEKRSDLGSSNQDESEQDDGFDYQERVIRQPKIKRTDLVHFNQKQTSEKIKIVVMSEFSDKGEQNQTNKVVR